MKKTIVFVVCSLLFFVSCDKIFVHVSGTAAELQGKWQMDDADTVYFNFQNNLFQYQIYRMPNVMSQAYGFYYVRENKGLDLALLREYAYFPLDYLGWDTLRSVTGLDTIFQSFTIEKLTNTKLILQSEKGKFSFHKF